MPFARPKGCPCSFLTELSDTVTRPDRVFIHAEYIPGLFGFITELVYAVYLGERSESPSAAPMPLKATSVCIPHQQYCQYPASACFLNVLTRAFISLPRISSGLDAFLRFRGLGPWR